MALKQKHTLLVVDDEPIILKSLQRLFEREGHEVLTAESGEEGMNLLEKRSNGVSMIISDQRMHGMSGVEFLERTKNLCPDAIRYLMTGNADLEAMIGAVNQGEIHRYVAKPWQDEDLVCQVNHSLENVELQAEVRRLTRVTLEQNRQLNLQNKELEQKVQARTREVSERNRILVEANRLLEQGFMDAVHLLSSMVEMLNPALGGRMRKAASLSRSVGEALGLEREELNKIEMAAMIHDIGLLALPEELWALEVRRMNDKQFRMYSQHPVMGSVILDRVPKLAEVGELVLFHHEQVDGQGFPNGFKGNQIPIGSKIILAVSDFFLTFETWPSDIRKLISKTHQYFEPSEYKDFTLEDDPERIVAEVAAKLLQRGVNTRYDEAVVSELVKQIYRERKIEAKVSITLDQIQAGMQLMEDLKLKDGRLLLSKGTALKEATIRSIQSLHERGMVSEMVTVSVPVQEEGALNA